MVCKQTTAGQWMAENAVARRGQALRWRAENEEIADLLAGLTDARKTWGFGLCFLHLRNVKGHPWHHKRVYRIYCELELNLRPSRDITAGCPAG
jgi:putative transposase